MSAATLGVVGAGVMGRGVSIAAAAAGIDVVLVDSHREALDAARTGIRTEARMLPMLAPNLDWPAAEDIVRKVRFETRLETLSTAEVVVENITESLQLKAELWPRLDTACRSATVLAANTSVIPIAHLAALTSSPERCIGAHFMNPVPLSTMVEVICSPDTGKQATEHLVEMIGRLGKAHVVVADGPGFAINRVLMPLINEAAAMVREGVASAAEIDRLFRGALGHSMGPLETADLIGIDTVLNSLETLHQLTGDRKHLPDPGLAQMVESGKLGRKGGGGFRC